MQWCQQYHLYTLTTEKVLGLNPGELPRLQAMNLKYLASVSKMCFYPGYNR